MLSRTQSALIDGASMVFLKLLPMIFMIVQLDRERGTLFNSLGSITNIIKNW